VIYFIQDEGLNLVKIGYTGDTDASERLRALQTGSPAGLVLLTTIPGDRAREASLHERFAPLRVNGEWFKPGPALMFFMLLAQKAEAFSEGQKHAQENAYKSGRADGYNEAYRLFENCDKADFLEACDPRSGPNEIEKTFFLKCPYCEGHHQQQDKTDPFVFHCDDGCSWRLTFTNDRGKTIVSVNEIENEVPDDWEEGVAAFGVEAA